MTIPEDDDVSNHEAAEAAEANAAECHSTLFSRVESMVVDRKASRIEIKRIIAEVVAKVTSDDIRDVGEEEINAAVQRALMGVFIRFKYREKGAAKSGNACAHVVGAVRGLDGGGAVEWFVDVGEVSSTVPKSCGSRSSLSPTKISRAMRFRDG